VRDIGVFRGASEGGQPSRFLEVEPAHPVPFPAKHRGDGLMARATETDKILQRLMAEVRIGCVMHLGRHMLMPQLTAIAVALQDQTTLLAPRITAEIAEIRDVHVTSLFCRVWPIRILIYLGHGERYGSSCDAPDDLGEQMRASLAEATPTWRTRSAP
jgi:hypothetical protein